MRVLESFVEMGAFDLTGGKSRHLRDGEDRAFKRCGCNLCRRLAEAFERVPFNVVCRWAVSA